MTPTPHIATVADLLGAVRAARLLESAQLDELTGSPDAQRAEPQALARELVRRGWLTPYQVNQVFRGCGPDLLLKSYVLLERLGAGGMGEVFKARNWKLGQIVALKLIRKDRLTNPDAVRRFQREVRAVGQVEHPNIVRAFDADEAGGTHFLVMEYVPGTDLARLVKQQGPLPPAEAAEYVRQAALGLQHAHERGLVHRDVKPHNLLLAPGGTVKVLDLGLARLLNPGGEESTSTLTQDGVMMGTVDFVAPEQAMDSAQADIRADLYSLGCTLYYLLAGQAPFPRGSVLEKLMKHRLEEPAPLEQIRPEVPAELAAVVHRLLAKNPDDRFQTPAQLAVALAVGVPAGAAIAARSAPTTPTGFPALDSSSGTQPHAATPDSTAALPHRPAPAGTARPPRRPPVGAGIGIGIGIAILAGIVVAIVLLSRHGGPTGGSAGDTLETPGRPNPKADSAAAVSIRTEPGGIRRVRAPLYEAGIENDGCLTSLRVAGAEFLQPGVRDGTMVSRGGYLIAEGGRVLSLPRIEQPAPRVIEAGGDEAVVRYTFRPDSLDCDVTNRTAQSVQFSMVLCRGIQAMRQEEGAWAAVPVRKLDTAGRRTAWFMAKARLTISGATTAWGPWAGDYQVVAVKLGPKEAQQLTLHPGRVTADEAARVAVVTGARTLQEVFPTPPDPASEAAWKALAAGAADPRREPSALRAEALALRRQHNGTAAALRAAELLGRLPSPLDRLKKADIPPYELAQAGGGDPAEAPHGLVLILGDSRLRHWNGIDFLAFGAHGKTLVSHGQDGTAKLWDLDTGKALLTWAARAAAVTRDGTTLALGGPGSVVRLRDLAAGKDLAGVKTGLDNVETVALSDDGATLAAGGGGKVRVWDRTADGARPREFPGYLRALSPDGKTAAVADGPLRLLDTATGRERHALGLQEHGAAFSPDGKTLAAANGPTITLWDVATGTETRAWRADTWFVHDLTFTPDSKTLVVRGHGGFVELRDVGTGKAQRSWSVGLAHGLAVRSDGEILATGGPDKRIHFWSLATGREGPMPGPGGDSYTSAALDPDGEALALGTEDGRVQAWQPSSGRAPRDLARPSQTVRKVIFSPDGKLLATSGSEDVRLLEWATGRELPALPRTTGAVAVLAFHPDGKKLIGAHRASEDTLWMWDLASDRTLTAFSRMPGKVEWPAVSLNGRLLAAGSGPRPGAVRVWDLVTARELYTLNAGTETWNVGFSPDGRLLASQHAWDPMVHLWDPVLPRELSGRPGTCFAFRPDGKVLATAVGGDVRFWDLAADRETGSWRVGPAGGSISMIAYSPDGRYLVTRNGNGTLYVLRLTPPPR